MTSVLESLNKALHQALAADERVLLLGEDILDPYGGAFKVTRGLSESFPNQVLSTPISEAAIVGVAIGMALRGLRPVVEIMFGDFVTLTADQLINHAAKFHWMYNHQVIAPLVVRTPMGGRRGYGPTHSQTLEKLFLGVPGLRVLAPAPLGNPGSLLLNAIHSDDPVLFIENKLLYLLPIENDSEASEFEISETTRDDDAGQEIPFGPDQIPGSSYADRAFSAPQYSLRLRGAPRPTLTLATYGYMLDLARQAALRLAYEHEIFIEIVCPTQLAPFQTSQIIASAKRTRRLLTLEEGSGDLGWGAEVVSRVAQAISPQLLAVDRLAALPLPTPASGALEAIVLPGVDQIIQICQKIQQSR